jgi:hypothetical protein
VSSASYRLRFARSLTYSDFLFATYFQAILAAGLLAGLPAATGKTIVSALIVRLFFCSFLLEFRFAKLRRIYRLPHIFGVSSIDNFFCPLLSSGSEKIARTQSGK